MQGSSDNSFIPKQGTAKKKQVGGARQIYVFSYISYILMFATLLSSGGVYLYAQYVDTQLKTEIEALNSEIGSFSQADMERVTQFNERLTQAQDRLENSISVVSVFEALQAATIDTVQVESLQMERQDDDKVLMNTTIQTDSFDSTIFQRSILLGDQTIQGVEISQLQTALPTQDGTTELEAATDPVVTFQTLFEIPLAEVPADPQSYQTQSSQNSSIESATSTIDSISEPGTEQGAQQESVGDNNDGL